MTRATAVRASHPFSAEEEAATWLSEAIEADDTIDVLIEEGVGLLNRALHAHAVAAADPLPQALAPERALAARIGFGSGEAVAAGRATALREVDARVGGPSRRRRRAEELRPQERLAALLGGRERLDACETVLLRARADLDAGRDREAAIQLAAGVDTALVELADALDDPDHERDMAALRERRAAARAAADAAVAGDLDAARAREMVAILETAERILRRRRVLRGG